MQTKRISTELLAEGIGLAVFFTVLGSLIIIVFSQYRPLLPAPFDLAGRLALLAVLLAAAQLARLRPGLRKYWQMVFGLFILALAVSLDWWAAGAMAPALERVPDPAVRFALEKFKTGLIVTLTVVLLTRLSGNNLGSIYVQKGKLKLGLLIGLAAFGIAAAGSVPLAQVMFQGGAVAPAELARWSPWILLFVLSNAANEELLFRGLFLRRLEPFYGKFLSNLLIVFVFTGLHLGVTYSRDQMLFLAVLVPLGLAWGYLMQKTEGVWASILFHAGMDIPVILGILSAR
jgi:membrane protease YdiL (CAAX protease family)